MKFTMKNLKQTAAAGVVLLAVMMAVSACGNKAGNTGNNAGNTPDGSDIGSGTPSEQLPEGNGMIDSGSPDTDTGNGNAGGTDGSANPGEAPQPEQVILSGEGTYTGAIDSNSIEIMTDEGPAALRITPELADKISGLPSDAKVKFQYTELVLDSESNLKQLWLESIEEIE